MGFDRLLDVRHLKEPGPTAAGCTALGGHLVETTPSPKPAPAASPCWPRGGSAATGALRLTRALALGPGLGPGVFPIVAAGEGVNAEASAWP